MNLLWFLLIGLAAGWLAGRLTKGRGFGLVGNLVVGIIGALIGGFVFDVLGLSARSTCGNLVMATVGALVLVFALQALGNRKRPR